MYVKIRRHQHTRVHAHTGPRRHTRAPAYNYNNGGVRAKDRDEALWLWL